MSLDDDKALVLDGIKTLGVDALMWREEQYGANDERCHWHDENSALAALDRILAALDDAESWCEVAAEQLEAAQQDTAAAEERARVAEAERDWLAYSFAQCPIAAAGRQVLCDKYMTALRENHSISCKDCRLAAAREAVERSER